jgi:hypothetical protein
LGFGFSLFLEIGGIVPRSDHLPGSAMISDSGQFFESPRDTGDRRDDRRWTPKVRLHCDLTCSVVGRRYNHVL